MIALFALAASHLAVPAQFVGRWESTPEGCGVAIDDKAEADFVVIEPTKLWTYEADDRILAIEAQSATRLVAKVMTASEGQETRGRAELFLVDHDHLRVKFGADWTAADYIRCLPRR